MSSPALRHSEEELLLRYVDGELSGRKAKQVRAHLEACWQCRTELEAFEATIGECVHYRKNVLAECLAPAPAQWKPLDFDSVDSALVEQSLGARLARLFSARQTAALRWALSGAAVLALAFLAINKLGETPKVEAAALLKKAVAASSARPHTPKKLRIKTRTAEITRVVFGGASHNAGEEPVARLFRAAHYDWNDPLSAKAYSDWREQLSRKQDQLTPDTDSYSIKTTTDEGELLSASLKMRASDLEPLEGRFEFRNHEWVEMTELVDQLTLPASTVAGTAGGVPRQPGTPPVTPSLAPDAPAVSAYAEELQVFTALHRVGADLGDPVEVSRDGSEVLVSGTGVSHQHQEQLHALLDRLPHVTVRFSDPTLPASNPPAQEPATRDAAASEKPKYPARLEARLGGRPQFERFSAQVLDWSDSAMTRVFALRRLAQQFAADRESAMRPEERRTLHTLAREHAAALAKDIQKITNTVKPVLKDVGAAEPLKQLAGPDQAWQSDAEDLFRTGRQLETLLASALGITAGQPPTQEVNSQLLTVLSHFSFDTEQCLRHLSYDDVRQSK